MKKIITIAKYLFVESFRNKIFITVMLIAIFIISANFALDFYSQGIQNRLIFDFGSSLASIIGAFLCIYLLTTQIRGEIENKLAYFALTSETSRTEYLLGKYFGTLIFVAFGTLVLFLEIFLIIYFNSNTISFISMIYYYVMILKFSVLCSLTVLFAVISSLVITPVLAAFAYIIGHWSGYINYVAKKSGSALINNITELLTFYIIPNFNFYTAEHVSNEAFKGAAAYLTSLTLYSVSLNLIILITAVKLFERKDI
ncbi:MAG: hypothetical protein QMC67_12415 [Candidatus Wallbacteria bacterium]